MNPQTRTILLLSDDALWAAAARHAIELRNPLLRVAAIGTVGGAQRILEAAAPAVIILEQSCVRSEMDGAVGRLRRLEAVAAWLSGYAPIVVAGAEDGREQMATLIAAGAVDFIVSLDTARLVEAVEKRLKDPTIAGDVAPNPETAEELELPIWGEDFGEVLRHELNNPLTGILGNAELLLADVRRKNDGRLPNGAQERLETIATLAVRLRETVARLSREWEGRREPHEWCEADSSKRVRV